MQPDIHLNFLAILAGVVASIVIGFLWYGPLCGKAWMKEMNVPPDHKPEPGVMRKSMIIMVVGSILTTYVLAWTVQGWRPSVWHAGQDGPSLTYGFFAAFFTWLGFYLPQHLGQVAWERKSWKLFSINAAHSFVSLQVVAMILAVWR